jgi:hypothetical protein
LEIWGVPVLAATTVGFAYQALVKHTRNRRFTRASSVPHSVALPKFLAVAPVGAGISGRVAATLRGGAGLPYALAQVLATGSVLVLNLPVNALWTFRGHSVP